MLKISKATIFLIAIMLMAGVSYAGNSAKRCLDTRRDGDRFYFTNTCDYNIFVFYCSKDVKQSGKYCGDYTKDRSKGTFFTHSFNLKAGDERYKWKVGSVRYGACKGKSGFEKSFKDSPGGRYTCPEPWGMHD